MRSLPERNVMTALALLLILACAGAREPTKAESRRVSKPRLVDLCAEGLEPAAGVKIIEGPRELRDAFPYFAATRDDENYFVLTPQNLGSFLAVGQQGGVGEPAAIRTDEAAIAAIRLFVPGALVTSEEQADRILLAALEFGKRAKHLAAKITKHRPESYAPTATPLPQDRSIRPVEAWKVSLVALEMNHYLALVHIQARVRATGEIEMERHLIVDGPMTSWQSAYIGEPTEADRRASREMYEEATLAWKLYAKALRPARDIDTIWACARILANTDQLADLFGEPDERSSGRLEAVSYTLADGTSVCFETKEGRIRLARQSPDRRSARVLKNLRYAW